MAANDPELILQNLCNKQKLERDRALTNLTTLLSKLDASIIIHNLQAALLGVINDPSSGWEALHGCLLGLKIIVELNNKDVDIRLMTLVREAAFKLLTHTEVRVRQAAGEVLGALCKGDAGATYVWCKSDLLELVKSNLQRDETSDEASQDEHRSTKILLEKLGAANVRLQTTGDAAQIFHDTAGWRNLETSMKCLEHIINGSGHDFLPFINQELLELIFVALNHTNRFVRETGYNVCGALVATAGTEDDELLEHNPLLTYGDQLSFHLGKGLSDNWSQVRLASSVATRKFLTALPLPTRERFYPVFIPRICLNRYYVAEGVRLYSQETWRLISQNEGKVLVQNNIETVVNYYIESTEADNHAVREAACSCIAELAHKLQKEPVQPYVKRLLKVLIVCFNDDSWPVRDAACTGCSHFVSNFPEESADSMDELYPLFFSNLKDNIPSVRVGAADALAIVANVYGSNAMNIVNEYIMQGFEGVSNQESETDRYGELDTGPATFGVAKRLRDNDPVLHSDKTMYSCGSLAPKLSRGGCSDCRYRRPSQPWEIGDGCVYLLSQLSLQQSCHDIVIKALPLLAKSLQKKHYQAHLVLHETVCKVLPNIAKGLGKRPFKTNLALFIDTIFYALHSDNALTVAAASSCLCQLSVFLGKDILKGRINEHNPGYVEAFEANNINSARHLSVF